MFQCIGAFAICIQLHKFFTFLSNFMDNSTKNGIMDVVVNRYKGDI